MTTREKISANFQALGKELRGTPKIRFVSKGFKTKTAKVFVEARCVRTGRYTCGSGATLYQASKDAVRNLNITTED